MIAMRKMKLRGILPGVLMPLLILAVLLCFMTGISNLSRGSSAEDKARLEQALKEASVACYSIEGFYPPDLEYLETHYGIRIDRRHFDVNYTAVAENIMPDITVIEK